MSLTQPDDVYAELLAELPPGAVLTGAIVAVSYVVPGEADEIDRTPRMQFNRDETAGPWTHLGMLEVVANTLRNTIEQSFVEDDDDG